MNKSPDSLLLYSSLDSKRIKNAFFSQKKNNPKKKNIKKIALISAGVVSVLILGVLSLFSKYDLFIVRRNIEIPPQGISLINDKEISSLRIKNKTRDRIEIKSSPLRLAVNKGEETTLQIDLKEPVNLYQKPIFIYLRSEPSLKINAIFKDNRFFSNSLNPISLSLPEGHSDHYTKITLAPETQDMQNTNLFQIKQINLAFYSQDEKKSEVFIKDIIVEVQDESYFRN